MMLSSKRRGPIVFLIFLLPTVLGFSALAAEGGSSPVFEQVQSSTKELLKEWDNTKKEYKRKFKAQMKPVEKSIEELRNTLDHGDPAKRKDINKRMEEAKQLRDEIRKVYHEFTATSLVNLASKQKHFINAKKNTEH